MASSLISSVATPRVAVTARASRDQARPARAQIAAREAAFSGARFGPVRAAAPASVSASRKSLNVSAWSFGADLIRPNIGTFMEDLDKHKALSMDSPPDGGYEGRYKCAVTRAGYKILDVNARGLGDVEAYLTKNHGVRPPPLGRQPIQRFFEPGLATTMLEAAKPKKGVCVWIQDGLVLSKLELSVLCSLTVANPDLKVVVERGRARDVVWKPLLEEGQVVGAF